MNPSLEMPVNPKEYSLSICNQIGKIVKDSSSVKGHKKKSKHLVSLLKELSQKLSGLLYSFYIYYKYFRLDNEIPRETLDSVMVVVSRCEIWMKYYCWRTMFSVWPFFSFFLLL